MNLDLYVEDWNKFRRYIEKKAKGRCIINNKNWGKLRDYHLEKFIKNVNHPYGFLFKIIYMSNIYKNIPSVYKMYYKYKRRKQQELLSGFRIKTRPHPYRRYR